MPSPFPGMNPYLEQPSVWHGFHDTLVVECRNSLVQQIRPAFIATLEENIYIHELSGEERRLLGRRDVSVVDFDAPQRTSSGGVAVAAPVIGRVLPNVDVLRECFIEIRDRQSRELITVIELLSPANKYTGSDRDQFLNKRYQLMRSTAHYVEIDLLRGGPRLPIENLPDCDAYAMVSRVDERPQVGLWPVSLREALPTIPIPLRPPAKDAVLDLQDLLQSAYDAGGYEDYIYAGKPDPQLSEAEAAWAGELLEQAAGRSVGARGSD